MTDKELDLEAIKARYAALPKGWKSFVSCTIRDFPVCIELIEQLRKAEADYLALHERDCADLAKAEAEIEQLRAALREWQKWYWEERPHQTRMTLEELTEAALHGEGSDDATGKGDA